MLLPPKPSSCRVAEGLCGLGPAGVGLIFFSARPPGRFPVHSPGSFCSLVLENNQPPMTFLEGVFLSGKED
jgi:hypothetical protein